MHFYLGLSRHTALDATFDPPHRHARPCLCQTEKAQAIAMTMKGRAGVTNKQLTSHAKCFAEVRKKRKKMKFVPFPMQRAQPKPSKPLPQQQQQAMGIGTGV